MDTATNVQSIRFVALVLLFVLPFSLLKSEVAPTPAKSDFVDVRRFDATIVVDLRYASENNFIHRAIYPPSMPPLVRLSVAQRLAVAQKFLKARGFGLKIWDAYRPQDAQTQLWEAIRNHDFVADPKEGIGSMHTRGVAVDATLVDRSGKEVAMPTDFDNFTPAAMLSYQGTDPKVRFHLNILQKAMARAGFYGLRTEWWHFCAGDWAEYAPVPEVRPVVTVSQLQP